METAHGIAQSPNLRTNAFALAGVFSCGAFCGYLSGKALMKMPRHPYVLQPNLQDVLILTVYFYIILNILMNKCLTFY